MKKLLLLGLVVLLAGCGAPYAAGYVSPVGYMPAGSGTPGNAVLDAQATLNVAQAAVNTQEAEERQRAAQATNVRLSTQQAAQEEIDLLYARQTDEWSSYQLNLAAAQATEAYTVKQTAQARMDLEATVAASATAERETQQAVQATQAAVPTATYVAGVATQQAQSAAVSHYAGLAWRVIWPVGLAALFAALVAGALYLAWSNRDAVRRWLETQELKNRVIESPALGRLIIERLADGRMVVYDPARMPGAGGIIDAQGVTVTGLGADPELVRQVLARAQAVELARSMPRRQVIDPHPQPLPLVGGGEQERRAVVRVVDGASQPVAGWLADLEERLFLEG